MGSRWLAAWETSSAATSYLSRVRARVFVDLAPVSESETALSWVPLDAPDAIALPASSTFGILARFFGADAPGDLVAMQLSADGAPLGAALVDATSAPVGELGWTLAPGGAPAQIHQNDAPGHATLTRFGLSEQLASRQRLSLRLASRATGHLSALGDARGVWFGFDEDVTDSTADVFTVFHLPTPDGTRRDCPAGFEGAACASPIPDCSASPCAAGTCGDVTTPSGVVHVCTCPSTRRGPRCELDVNECASPTACGANWLAGSCWNALDGFVCGCAAGYQNVGTGAAATCEDVDECADPGFCSLHGTCTNGVGSFACACTTGWTGARCELDVDECKAPATCSFHGTCTNGVGSFACACATGWTGTTCASDVDECATGNGGCSTTPMVACTNVPGGRTCAPCPSGYVGDGTACTDVDECATNNGGCSTTPMVVCTNAPGSMSCAACPAGYSGNGFACANVNECASATACRRDQSASNVCTDSVGSYSCACGAGFVATGSGLSASCADVDECAVSTACGKNLGGSNGCTNTVGGYTCTCAAGFVASGSGLSATCVDVNECAASTACGKNLSGLNTCTNAAGGYTCACGSGFAASGSGLSASCVDVNECATGNGGCSTSPMVGCTNTVGGRTCGACPAGYTGDGVTCTNVNECAASTACGKNLSASNTCTDTPGGYTCACGTGFNPIGSGLSASCQIVDCGSPPAVVNGSIATAGGTTYTQTATYSCMSGYVLTGSATRTCQASGTWSGSAPTCPPVNCGALSNPTNGTVSTPGGTTYTQTATYACNTGYTLTGSATRTCQANATWGGTAPTCPIVVCPMPAAPRNGTVSATNRNYLSYAQYACNTGFIASGPLSRQCQANGTWAGVNTQCVVNGFLGDFDADGFRDDHLVWNPSNGQWTARLTSGTAIFSGVSWGSGGQIPLIADVDSDGKLDDLIVWDPNSGTWWAARTDLVPIVARNFGLGDDVPLVGDFDDDGFFDDFGIWTPSTKVWSAIRIDGTSIGTVTVSTALSTDVPLIGDMDSDGYVDDLVLFRQSTNGWSARTIGGTTISAATLTYGMTDATPFVIDLDYDGKLDDIGYYQRTNGRFYARTLSGSTSISPMSFSSDYQMPIVGDFDGNGNPSDLGVYDWLFNNWTAYRQNGTTNIMYETP